MRAILETRIICLRHYTKAIARVHLRSLRSPCDRRPLHRPAARRQPQRGPVNHSRGALSQPRSVCSEIDAYRTRRAGTRRGGMGRDVPLTIPLGGLGSVARSTSGVPCRKWILCKPCRTPFSVFLSNGADGGAPKTSWNPDKFTHPPFDGPAFGPSLQCDVVMRVTDNLVSR